MTEPAIQPFTAIPHAILEKASRLRMRPNETAVFLAFVRLSYGWHRAEVQRNISQLGALTGLCASSLCRAIRGLIEKGLLRQVDGRLSLGGAFGPIVEIDNPEPLYKRKKNNNVVIFPKRMKEGLTPSRPIPAKREITEKQRELIEKSGGHGRTITRACSLFGIEAVSRAVDYVKAVKDCRNFGAYLWATLKNRWAEKRLERIEMEQAEKREQAERKIREGIEAEKAFQEAEQSRAAAASSPLPEIDPDIVRAWLPQASNLIKSAYRKRGLGSLSVRADIQKFINGREI